MKTCKYSGTADSFFFSSGQRRSNCKSESGNGSDDINSSASQGTIATGAASQEDGRKYSNTCCRNTSIGIHLAIKALQKQSCNNNKNITIPPKVTHHSNRPFAAILAVLMVSSDRVVNNGPNSVYYTMVCCSSSALQIDKGLKCRRWVIGNPHRITTPDFIWSSSPSYLCCLISSV